MPSRCGLTVTLRCQRVVIHNVEDCLSQMTSCCALTGSRAPHAAAAAEGEACACDNGDSAAAVHLPAPDAPHAASAAAGDACACGGCSQARRPGQPGALTLLGPGPRWRCADRHPRWPVPRRSAVQCRQLWGLVGQGAGNSCCARQWGMQKPQRQCLKCRVRPARGGPSPLTLPPLCRPRRQQAAQQRCCKSRVMDLGSDLPTLDTPPPPCRPQMQQADVHRHSARPPEMTSPPSPRRRNAGHSHGR